MMSFRCQITKLMHSTTMRPRHTVEALFKLVCQPFILYCLIIFLTSFSATSYVSCFVCFRQGMAIWTKQLQIAFCIISVISVYMMDFKRYISSKFINFCSIHILSIYCHIFQTNIFECSLKFDILPLFRLQCHSSTVLCIAYADNLAGT